MRYLRDSMRGGYVEASQLSDLQTRKCELEAMAAAPAETEARNSKCRA